VRTKTSQLEIQDIFGGMVCRSGDEAHDRFIRTFSVVQVSSESAQRFRAMKLLATARTKPEGPRLFALVVSFKSPHSIE